MDDTGSYQTESLIRSDDNYWDAESNAGSIAWLTWIIVGVIGFRLLVLLV